MDKFTLKSKYKLTGDQPEATAKLIRGLEKGLDKQILLGVTGSGKTFTAANVIEKINKPTLVISHNKTLAAQLYSEFKEFFPDNAVFLETRNTAKRYAIKAALYIKENCGM